MNRYCIIVGILGLKLANIWNFLKAQQVGAVENRIDFILKKKVELS